MDADAPSSPHAPAFGLPAARALEPASTLRSADPLRRASGLSLAPAPPPAPAAAAATGPRAAPDTAPAGGLGPAADPGAARPLRPSPSFGADAESAPRARDDAVEPPAGDGTSPTDREPTAPDELSGLRLLLDQLDALLRDPTLALWLRSVTGRLTDGVRGAGAATAAAMGRLARAVMGLRLRLPPFGRRLLLALLALMLPLALLALLTSGDEDRQGDRPSQASAPAEGGGSLRGLGMPALRSGPQDPRAVNVALVVNRTYDPAALRRELGALGTWLQDHHARGTRITLIDARTARVSRPLRARELAGARATGARTSTTSAIRTALGSDGRRLLVTLGAPAKAPGSARALRLTTRRGAASAAAVPIRRGRRSSATIDDRRPQALASSIARAIMAMSGQRERR